MSTSAGAITLDLTLNSKIEEQLKNLTKGIADKFSGSVEEINGRLEKSIQKPFESMQKASEKANKSIAKPFEGAEKAAEKAAKGVKDTFTDTYSDVEGAVSKCMARMEAEQKKFTESAAKFSDINTNTKSEVSTPKKSAMASMVPSMDELDKYVGKVTEKAEKLPESFRAATDPVDLLNQKLDVTYAKIGDAQREADELLAKYNQIANAKGADSNEAMAADKAFTSAQDKLIRLQESVSRTESKLNQAVAKAGQSVNSTADQASNAVKKAASSAGSAVENNLGMQLNRCSSLAQKANGKFSSIRAMLSKVGSVGKNTFSKIGSVGKTALTKIGNVGKTAFSKLRSNLKSTDKSARNTNGLFSKLGKTVKGVFKATFITAALYGAFRGLKSLFSDAMSQSTEFQKSLNNLKANFKIAFQPVVSTVLPILTKLMNALSQVMAKVASFISGVFGTTYDKSKQAAKQASQTAKKSSEEAEKYLNSYDVMNKAQDTSKEKSDSEDDGVDFDAVDTKGSKAAEKLGAKFKKIMSELFAPIKDAWTKNGQPVMDSIKTTAGKIKKLFVDIGKDFKDVWTDGTGERFVSSILNLVRSIVTTVGKIAGAFDKAWNKCDRGKKLIQSIFDSATKVNKLFKDISDSIGKAFDSPAGVKFFSNILSIVTNISNFIGKIAEGFTKAWEKAGLGDAIMLNLLKLFNSITGFVDRITGSLAKWAGGLDFTPILTSINTLLEGITSLSDAIGGVLGDAFESVLMPLASWVFEKGAPAAIETFSSLLDSLGTIIDSIRPGLETFYDKVLKPIGSWAGSVIIEALGKLKNLFSTVAGVFKNKGSEIQNVISGISDILKRVWEYIKPTLNTIITFIMGVFDSLIGAVKGVVSGVIDWLSGIIDFVKAVFKGDWKAAWEAIKKITKAVWDTVWSIIKGVINLIIDGINLLWGGIYRAISGIINCVGKVAGAIGDLFGKDWHFSMPENPKTIPPLAKGGLATAPTLAMVGDNRNAKVDPEVIAPLSKLQGMLDNGSNNEIISLLKEILEFLRNINFEFIGKFDLDVLYKCIVKLNQSNTNRTGVNALA